MTGLAHLDDPSINRFSGKTPCRQIATGVHAWFARLLLVIACCAGALAGLPSIADALPIGGAAIAAALPIGGAAIAGPQPTGDPGIAQAPVVPDGSNPGADVDEILSDPRYDASGGDGLGDQLRRAWEWLRDTVQQLLFGDGRGVASGVGVGVVLVLLGALTWAAIRGGRRIARDRLAAAVASSAPTGPDEWEARAREAAGAGDLEAAVHALFRALALRFGIVTHRPDEPGRTAGEVRRAAATAPHGRLVVAAVDAFEAVAYGGVEATPSHVQPLRDANRALAEATGAPALVFTGGPT